MGSQVVLLRCDEYDVGKVYAKIAEGIELLGGFSRFFKSGEKILLKPNLLAPDPPETATATHPAVFEAVGRIILDGGVKANYGDSPAFADPLKAFKRSGMYEAAVRLGIRMADFTGKERVFFEEAKQNRVFEIARGVREVDGIVSLPKLKTHGLTLLTGAIKNQFGCIPGMAKSAFHGKLDTVDRFSQMLVDLTMLLRPRLYIMDGIVGMEGNGPRRGSPVHMGVLLLSDDPVALDSVAARVICLGPDLVIPIVKGTESGLGVSSGYGLIGERIEDVRRKFRLPRYGGNFNTLPPLARKLFKSFLIPRPIINRAKCVKCYECMRICPTDPKSITLRRDRYPAHIYTTCINCYCCQETCPEGAITLRVKPL